ncbi:conserved membrane hypothetical protein [Frankia canadensis]|uniref:DUF2637 domain-containing protein n=1 Tax=Frankia canadensis TaxID=1836972 RepID=A0A2I2KU51_9ACTN|nr:DUF2637 domain-containing protein [Frankia canadensis]SNQ49187.1 conserved membrane hypothetical protein [Frankia canadensis]SOU56477.1 conserved membrane hypothetical protein [Frankia canadensis]
MADGQLVDGDRSRHVRGTRAIRTTTVTAVSIVAAVAAFASYRHMRAVALEHGEDAMTSAVLPLSVDGLIVAASMTMLADRRAGRGRGGLSYLMLALGACASLAANMLHAEPSLAARIIAGWPPLALLGSYELLMRQIHPDAAPRTLPRLSIPGQRHPVLPTPQAQPAAPSPSADPAPPPTATLPAADTVSSPAAVSSPATPSSTALTAVPTPLSPSAPAPLSPSSAGGVPASSVPSAPPSQGATPVLSAPTADGAHDEARRDGAAGHASPDDASPGDASPGDASPGDVVPAGVPAAAPAGPVTLPVPYEITEVDHLATTIPLATLAPGGEPGAGSPAAVVSMDPTAKRAAIVRALGDAGGSATAAVAILATQGITVSKSWVYQVRRETAPAQPALAPGGEPSSGVAGKALRGRHRGLAPDHRRAAASVAAS